MIILAENNFPSLIQAYFTSTFTHEKATHDNLLFPFDQLYPIFTKQNDPRIIMEPGKSNRSRYF